jgi:hypothetical protein
VFRALLVLAAVAVAAQLAYTFSGSGKWEYLGTRKGVTMYSKKLPGENQRKYYAIMRVKSSMSGFIAFMLDDASDVDAHFYAIRVLRRDSPHVFINAWRSEFAPPFADRDFVVRNTFTQDPKTLQLTWELEGLPDYIPQDSCCVRVAKMENSWHLTPLPNGEIEIRWVNDMNVGGWVPYFVMNEAQQALMNNFGSHIQEWVNKDKYINAKLDYVTEPQL